jgi:gentisate 1,2-dioxygenase
VPNWTWHHHANTSAAADAFLFWLSDRPLLESVGLYRVDRGTAASKSEAA